MKVCNIGLLATLVVFCSLAHAAEFLSVADYLEYELPADPQISPDGDKIIYTRRWIDKQKDQWRSSLWIVDADGSNHRFLSNGSNARWSPSGDRIAYLANDANNKLQLFVRWMDASGATSQVTRVSHRPYVPTWSPDGQSIAFVAIMPAKDTWKIDMPSAPEGSTWTKAPRILDRLHYRQDGIGFTEPGFSHLFVVPSDSGTARQLTEGEWNVGPRFDQLFRGAGVSWMPDSKAIVFDGLLDPGDMTYRDSAILRIDVDSKEITQLTSEPGSWNSPTVSPDGKRIAYSGYAKSDLTYEMQQIHVMDADGGNPRIVDPDFDRPANNFEWSSNRQLHITAAIDGYFHIYRLGLSGGAQPVTSGKDLFRFSSLDGNGRSAAAIGSTATRPGDIYLVALNGRSEPVRLTGINEDLLASKTLGAVEDIWFEAEDGNRAHGWIVKPPNFDPNAKYPLIMEIHGGPFGMYNGAFRFLYQAFAANGYVVLYTNPRGSTGYGEAFSQAINFAYPSVDYLDLIGAVDATVAQGYIDTKRMYVGGCSGGGKLSSWVIAHTDRFAAAAVRCPVANWISMAGTSDVPYFSFSFFKKPFWEDPEPWLHHSSLMHVGKVKTPTIVMTGEKDRRTPMAQSEEYYAALKLVGVPAKLLRFNDEYHGTASRPSNMMRTLLYMMDWYSSYTLDGPVEDD